MAAYWTITAVGYVLAIAASFFLWKQAKVSDRYLENLTNSQVQIRDKAKLIGELHAEVHTLRAKYERPRDEHGHFLKVHVDAPEPAVTNGIIASVNDVLEE